MSRYTGPIRKKARRYNFSILENNQEFNKNKKKTSPPGQHANKRVKLSEYGLQLREKQKVKFMYGLNERQMINTFKKSKLIKTNILGVNFLIMLESRLDNLVYRLGLSNTRRGARQLVNHKHILVNQKCINIPSYICKVNDEITLKEKSKKLKTVTDAIKNHYSTLKFVRFNKTNFIGTYLRYPKRNELNQDINESLIIELYNRII